MVAPLLFLRGLFLRGPKGGMAEEAMAEEQ